MSFKEELKGIDPEDIRSVFDEVFPPAEQEGDPGNEAEFMQAEVTKTWLDYPALHAIYEKMIEMGGRQIASGQLTEEKIHGMLIGGIVVQQVLSSYAEREVPDTLPPELS